MYEGVFDSEKSIFYATLTGNVTIDELAQGLRECFSQDFDGPGRSIWRVAEMKIDFALSDATQLVTLIRSLGNPSGKMAFVTGDQGFIKSVVDMVRASSDDWMTEWRSFENEADALAWLDE